MPYREILILMMAICLSSCATRQPEIKTSLQKLQLDFLTTQQREQNSVAFVDGLNKVIESSSFRFLLGCVKEWESQPDHVLRVKFPKGLVSANISHVAKVIEVNLFASASVQQTLPTYIHELLHVCQHLRDGELQVKSDSLEIYRNWAINEVAGIHLMNQAYWYFVGLDPDFKKERGVPHGSELKLYDAYEVGRQELREGIFAQRVLQWYKATDKPGVVQTDGDLVSYPASLNGPSFNMRKLDPVFKKRVQDLGILVKEK